jgi:osmotically-inducible protein OsmY
MPKTDFDITADVLAELAWDPAVTIADLDVATSNGHVTLSGTAATYTVKHAAARAAHRVYGVRGVMSAIVVDAKLLGVRSDAAIQADVRSALTLDALVPLDRVDIAVYNGIATLTGNLDYYYQREAAEHAASRIAGVFGVNDLITLAPSGPIAVDVADRIAQAFARNADLADDDVSVMVEGRAVTLAGTVSTWSECVEAEDAAWRAAGVREVVNNILVTY